jgi:hypothetical protein
LADLLVVVLGGMLLFLVMLDGVLAALTMMIDFVKEAAF